MPKDQLSNTVSETFGMLPGFGIQQKFSTIIISLNL